MAIKKTSSIITSEPTLEEFLESRKSTVLDNEKIIEKALMDGARAGELRNRLDRIKKMGKGNMERVIANAGDEPKGR